MSQKFSTTVTRGLGNFARHADAWDFLWSTSLEPHPLCRSDNLISATQKLFGDGELHVIFVFDSNREPVAAMPVIKRNLKGLPLLELPNNEWGVWGDLLLNPAYDSNHAISALVSGLRKIGHFVLRLNLVDTTDGRWHTLLQHLKNGGRCVYQRPAYSVGLIEHDDTWPEFRNRLSKGLKSKLSKHRRKLDHQGSVTFEVQQQLSVDQIDSVFKRIFEIENRSWKGAEGTSTTSHNMDRFYTEQARFLCQSNSLIVSFMQLNGTDIAFEFGMIANRIYYSFKIGFDSNYSACAPGHLLAEHLTEHFHVENVCDTQDTMGPISQATARWSSRSKQVSNVVVSGNVPGAKLAIHFAYAVRRFLARNRAVVEPPKPGAKPRAKKRIETQTQPIV